MGKRDDLINLVKEGGLDVNFCWEIDIPTEVFNLDDLKHQHMTEAFDSRFKTTEDAKKCRELIEKRYSELCSKNIPLFLEEVMLTATKAK